jgi:hypothetical protein
VNSYKPTTIKDIRGRREMEAEVMPLPMPEMTPPEMKMYLVCLTDV